MKKRRHRRTKAICAVLAALVLAGLMCIPKMPAYAAGNIKVDVASDGLGDDFEGFTFKLYEVGAYNGPDFQLYKEYEDVNVQIPRYKEDGSEDPDWQAKWLQAANNLAVHIEHPAEGETPMSPVQTFTGIKEGNPISYHSDKNALFLLVGETVTVDKVNYTPVPMFVRTLNGEEAYTMDATTKIKAEPVVFNHSVLKEWSGEPEDKEGQPITSLRPAAIDVGIYYGSQLIDTITLGGEGGQWTYSWQSEESGDTYYYINGEERKSFQPGPKDNAWDVKEIINEDEIKSDEARAAFANLRFYSPDYNKSASTTGESFIITNVFSSKSLELVKEIDMYDIDDQNLTFSFLIKGFNDNDEEPIYTNHVGVALRYEDGPVSEPTVVNYIPKDVTRITVEEEYSGNYTLKEPVTITFDEKANVWKVHATNVHNNHGPKSGVVNKYRLGNDKPEQQGID